MEYKSEKEKKINNKFINREKAIRKREMISSTTVSFSHDPLVAKVFHHFDCKLLVKCSSHLHLLLEHLFVS
jgi:transposase